MKEKNLFSRNVVSFVLILSLFIGCLLRLQSSHKNEQLQQLEEAVRRAAVTCYATEGFYPPSIDYLEAHYGLHWNSKDYLIHYDVFASNLMPDITVIKK